MVTTFLSFPSDPRQQADHRKQRSCSKRGHRCARRCSSNMSAIIPPAAAACSSSTPAGGYLLTRTQKRIDFHVAFGLNRKFAELRRRPRLFISVRRFCFRTSARLRKSVVGPRSFERDVRRPSSNNQPPVVMGPGSLCAIAHFGPGRRVDGRACVTSPRRRETNPPRAIAPGLHGKRRILGCRRSIRPAAATDIKLARKDCTTVVELRLREMGSTGFPGDARGRRRRAIRFKAACRVAW